MMNDFPLPAFSLGISPCPNDTFIFNELAQRDEVELHLEDVETLNQRALEGVYEVTKLSFHAWLHVEKEYELLKVGAALGRGCGPLVIVKGGMEELKAASTVAVPGEYTTAHLLLRLWNPQIEHRVCMPFDQIMDAVAEGRVEAGVIIHEGRFVFEERGFKQLIDLGAWWEAETGLPIPLGCIAAKKSLGSERIRAVERALIQSIEAAQAAPEATLPFVRAHAQELEPEVIKKHIATYVNAFTRDLGAEGWAAVEGLKKMAQERGVLK